MQIGLIITQIFKIIQIFNGVYDSAYFSHRLALFITTTSESCEVLFLSIMLFIFSYNALTFVMLVFFLTLFFKKRLRFGNDPIRDARVRLIRWIYFIVGAFFSIILLINISIHFFIIMVDYASLTSYDMSKVEKWSKLVSDLTLTVNGTLVLGVLVFTISLWNSTMQFEENEDLQNTYRIVCKKN